MFDPKTLNELAPVQIEHRQINLEAWRAETRGLLAARLANSESLGRQFRTLFASMPKAAAAREVRDLGLDHVQVSRWVELAARADGVNKEKELAPRKARTTVAVSEVVALLRKRGEGRAAQIIEEEVANATRQP